LVVNFALSVFLMCAKTCLPEKMCSPMAILKGGLGRMHFLVSPCKVGDYGKVGAVQHCLLLLLRWQQQLHGWKNFVLGS